MKPTFSAPLSIFQSLAQSRHKDSQLFSSDDSPWFWRLSDFTILFPSIFDITKPISHATSDQIKAAATKAFPEFIKLPEQPVHILNIRETYNAFDNNTKTIKTIKNGSNQHLTRIACEHIFYRYNGTESALAYFMFPDETHAQLKKTTQDIVLDRARYRSSCYVKELANIINRAKYTQPDSFKNIFTIIWRTLFNTYNMSAFYEDHNIKSTLLDYMDSDFLTVVNYHLLGRIIKHFNTLVDFTVCDIENYAKWIANDARNVILHHFYFKRAPENMLLEQSSQETIKQIHKARRNFWHENYPISLQQR